MFPRSFAPAVIVFAAVLPVFAAPIPPEKRDATLEFEGRYWAPDLDSDIASHGTELDVKSDLGVGDEVFPEGKVVWYSGPESMISFSYTQAGFDGDDVLARPIRYRDRTYPAGVRVVSDLDLSYFGFDWTWQFVRFLGGGVKAGTVIGARAISGNLTLDAPALAIHEEESFLAASPVAGAAVDIAPARFLRIFAGIAGMNAGGYGHILDAEAGITLLPFRHFSVSAGYRLVDVRVKDDPDFAGVRLQGPFAAAALRF